VKHDEFRHYMKLYQDFSTFDSLSDYTNNLEVIEKALELCIENNFQDLAVYRSLI
jgi:hypothetical protein